MRKMKASVRQALPYGYWVTPEGNRVVFNRRYEPMYLMSGRTVQRIASGVRVAHVRECWVHTGDAALSAADLAVLINMANALERAAMKAAPIRADILPPPVRQRSAQVSGGVHVGM
jgi:hypothetical protein